VLLRTRGRERVPTFARYLIRRLGTRGGRTAWRHFFITPFAAPSFAEFWREWNPVYGYVLSYYIYRPLTRLLPRTAAKLLTFVACGLVLHDIPAWLVVRRVLPPGATIAFTLFGLGVIVSDAFAMDLSRWPIAARVAVNVTYIAGCVIAMLILILRVAR
jgi:D-alanyl-lipoteichoic acid acyltransferase DltB (MBOAT superfamily)